MPLLPDTYQKYVEFCSLRILRQFENWAELFSLLLATILLRDRATRFSHLEFNESFLHRPIFDNLIPFEIFFCQNF
jgi:hypothetical protein